MQPNSIFLEISKARYYLFFIGGKGVWMSSGFLSQAWSLALAQIDMDVFGFERPAEIAAFALAVTRSFVPYV